MTMTAVELAQAVLAADGEPFVTLSMAADLPPVAPDSTVAEARRRYMRIAALIHPDKLQRSFERATEAFQCLVRAFEGFADPKLRRAAIAAAARRAKTTPARAGRAAKKQRVEAISAPPTAATAGTVAVGKAKKASTSASAARVRAKSKSAKPPAHSEAEFSSESSSSEDEEEEEEEEEEAWEEWLAADREPEVSTNRTPMGQPRSGPPNYLPTPIGCPHCRTKWEPDARPQYSLFMGQWGKRIHCQLCLFVFGCATALHSCPHCAAPFDYDASLYDSLIDCQKCKKTFGFPYYPVNQHLVDQIALEEWRESREREKTKAREDRARARGGDSANASRDDGESEKVQLLIGSCIMEEECPLCNTRVKSKHRQHVMDCLKKSPAERSTEAVRQPRKGTRKSAAPVAKKKITSPAKKAPPRASAAKKPKARPTPQKRRRRRSSDSESSPSASSEEDDDESDSSF